MNRGREGGEERRRRGCVNGRTCEMEDGRSAANQFLNRNENQRKPEENCSGPENENASISLGKYNANAKEFSTVFEHLDRSRRPHRSNRRQKNRFEMFRKINANPKKIVRAPKTRMRRFH